MKKYMHTIDGSPAIYFGEEQICFVGKSIRSSEMADSLQQIREEQVKSADWRKSKGWEDTGRSGYLIVHFD